MPLYHIGEWGNRKKNIAQKLKPRKHLVEAWSYITFSLFLQTKQENVASFTITRGKNHTVKLSSVLSTMNLSIINTLFMHFINKCTSKN